MFRRQRCRETTTKQTTTTNQPNHHTAPLEGAKAQICKEKRQKRTCYTREEYFIYRKSCRRWVQEELWELSRAWAAVSCWAWAAEPEAEPDEENEWWWKDIKAKIYCHTLEGRQCHRHNTAHHWPPPLPWNKGDAPDRPARGTPKARPQKERRASHWLSDTTNTHWHHWGLNRELNVTRQRHEPPEACMKRHCLSLKKAGKDEFACATNMKAEESHKGAWASLLARPCK